MSVLKVSGWEHKNSELLDKVFRIRFIRIRVQPKIRIHSFFFTLPEILKNLFIFVELLQKLLIEEGIITLVFMP